MNKTAGDLQRVLGQVAKEVILIVKSLMGESLHALGDSVGIFNKRYGLKIVGKPCEGKPHARFDEGRLGKSADCTSLLLYNDKCRNSK